MSLRIVPTHAHATQTTPHASAPSAPGLHDTLRTNLSLCAPKETTSTKPTTTFESSHPLEARLAQWRTQQDTLKMTLLRRQYGIAEPVKRGMEMQIVRSGEMSAGFGMGGSAGVSSDILAGRDWGMEWEDVYTGELGGGMGGVWGEGAFHERMERGFGMGW